MMARAIIIKTERVTLICPELEASFDCVPLFGLIYEGHQINERNKYV